MWDLLYPHMPARSLVPTIEALLDVVCDSEECSLSFVRAGWQQCRDEHCLLPDVRGSGDVERAGREGECALREFLVTEFALRAL